MEPPNERHDESVFHLTRESGITIELNRRFAETTIH
jgi:hypothetical protein